jgi:hypothetical protein
MRSHCLLIFAALIAVSSPARAAKFTAKAEEGRITVYSTSTKPEHCNVVAKFTYLENNKREEGWTACGNSGDVVTEPGKNVEVCRFEDPRIVAPMITEVAVKGCADKKK